MIIIGPYKLMLGVVDQCWWQGPDYPNGTSTWDTHGSWINCTTATKKACLFNASRATSSSFLSLPLLLASLSAPVQTRDAERRGRCAQVIEDPTEHNDLGEVPAYAHIVESMLGRMEELQPRVFDPDRGASKAETSAACKRVTENGGFWGCDAERPHGSDLARSCSMFDGDEKRICVAAKLQRERLRCRPWK